MSHDGRYEYDVQVGRLRGDLTVDDAMPANYTWIVLTSGGGKPWTRSTAFAFVESRRDQPEGTMYEITRRKGNFGPAEPVQRFMVRADGLAYPLHCMPLSPDANKAQEALFAGELVAWAPGDHAGIDELVSMGLAEWRDDGPARLTAAGRMRQRVMDASEHLYRVRGAGGVLLGYPTAIKDEAQALAVTNPGARIERRRVRGAKGAGGGWHRWPRSG